MDFLSIFTQSSVLVTLVALAFVIIGFRCLIYGVMGGTSTILRLIATVIFAGLAYYFWQYAASLSGSNIIDQFVFEAWHDIKTLVSKVINTIF
ncbi:MAG: hypothetical protein R8M71_02845 [Alphaproteobacteria bacterium]|nr:hypothetical protein [Alphaproteobacteria bacterium]MDW2995875.1 hypothetical protein [Alphaproteobacteria bacterium]